MRNLVVWRSFAWSFGIFVFGHLWRFHSVICDLQIIVCCLKPPIMSQILRKQCVNILFQLGVFYNIQRKSHFYKTLIFRILSEQRNIMEYHFAILIIWRSQVQALSGPQRKSTYERFVSAFSFVREHLANTEHNPRHPMNTGKSREHTFGVRKIPNHHLMIILSSSNRACPCHLFQKL